MNTILISYDLIDHESSQTYKTLIEQIEKYPDWCKPLESFWLVKTSSSASEVRDALKAFIDSDDKLFVADVTGDGWASKGLAQKINEWIKEKM